MNQTLRRLAADLHQVTRRARLNADEKAPAGENRSLAREHPFAEAGHLLPHPARRADGIEPAGHDDGYFCDGPTGLADHLARLGRTAPAVGLATGDLRRPQSGERPRPTRPARP